MAEKKPVSTKIWNFFVGVIDYLVFIVFGNPATMVVFNFFSPRLTRLWVRNKRYFGESIYAFYTWMFTKLPFRWAKWWLNPKDLQNYSVNKQVMYFNKVSPSAQTFSAIIADAEIQLVKTLPAAVFIKLMPELRFAPNTLKYMLQNGRFDILNEYIKHGAWSVNGLKLLIKTISKEAPYYQKKILLLEKYAIRYKLSNNEMDMIYHQCLPADYERLKRANLCYEQIRKVRYFVGLVNEQEEREWAAYCQNNTFEPEAQAEMTLAQYKIFSKAGCCLAPKAIIALLHKPNEKYWREIFVREPGNALICDEITDFVLGTPQVMKVYLDRKS